MVVDEVMKKAVVSNMGEKNPTLIFRKDRSFTIIGKKDPKATSYTIFAPSIVGKHVGAFNKAGENMVNSEEFKELSEKEKEYLKGFEGKEYRKKREKFRNSKEFKELSKKMKEKSFSEYLKILSKSSE